MNQPMQIYNTLFQLIINLGFVVLLSGCVPGALKVSINNSQDKAPEFSVSHESGDCDVDDAVFVKTILVGKPLNGKLRRVWLLRSDDIHGSPIHTFKYGILPEGFHEDEKSQPLTPGDEYEIIVHGNVCSGGLRFKIRNYH